jgi:putative salt-induced outer membrane protein YdiY
MRDISCGKIKLSLLGSTILTLFILGAMPFQVEAAPKTDVIIFTNGDRLTGEIKSLKRGQLSFNTDATGTISIEWDKISRIISNQYIQVETSSGSRYYGQLKPVDDTSGLRVVTQTGPEVLDNSRVILMEPIEVGRALDVLDIDLTLGYNFAKAGGVKQGTFGVEVDYRTRQRIYSVLASTTTNDSNDQEQSTRSNLELVYRRLRANRWYIAGNLNFEQNDELGLDLRRSLGINAGRFMIQSNSMLLDLQAGLQFSRESLVDEPDDTNSIEALFGAKWDWFRYDSPELDWSTTVQVIPNLSDIGRVRGSFDTTLRWELIKDLKWGISFYSSFDNKAAEEASNSDYGVNTNVSYSF